MLEESANNGKIKPAHKSERPQKEVRKLPWRAEAPELTTLARVRRWEQLFPALPACGLSSTALRRLPFYQLMGCNASRGAAVVEPSEKPPERPTTATSTEETAAVEAVDADGKDLEQEENESSG